jgi:hypothetical protein
LYWHDACLKLIAKQHGHSSAAAAPFSELFHISSASLLRLVEISVSNFDRLGIIQEPENKPSVKGETLLWIKCRRTLLYAITADHAPAGIGGKSGSHFGVRRNVPAEKEEEGLIAEAVLLAGGSRSAEPESTGTEVALKDGTRFEQDPKILVKVSMTVSRNHGLEC